MKTFQEYLDEANAVVPSVSTEEGIAMHAAGDTIFVDVRDSNSLRDTGTIAGAHHVPRGMIELCADEASPFYRDIFQKDAKIALVCGAGVMAALSGKTLMDMGFTDVTNVGGVPGWKEAGGPTEEV